MVEQLESDIAEWRALVAQRPAIDGHDLEELEAHLRDQIADLAAAGLAEDEAFLIAVRRMGALDGLSQEFARENRGRLWRQLVLTDGPADGTTPGRWTDAIAAAVAAGVAIQIARLASGWPEDESVWVLRNASLFVLPFLAAYFARRRQLTTRWWLLAAAPFALSAVVINAYPYRGVAAATELLVAALLPVVLWFAVGVPYVGGDVGSHGRRMDFVRFTGEWVIYYALIALGGGVLMGLTAGILLPTGVDPERIIEWVVPSGAAGAVVIAAWLVESKQQVVENMAPVLTMIFTPLFAVMLAAAVVVYAVTGLGGDFDRELLGLFDALMVVVLGLVLYGMSARGPATGPGWMDRIQLVAVIGALVLDVMVLGSMLARIGELGFTPNRAAALGLNLVLLVNLAGTAWLSLRFLTGRTTFHRLERWQTAYLPVLPLWAAIVVVVLPPLFGFR